MDARTEDLMALVNDGATLEEAGRAYGISGERVRQIFKEGGMSAGDLPGRAERQRGKRFALPRELAPVIEAMWREGMLYHEIAKVFDTHCEAVRGQICERVPAHERAAHAEERLEDPRSSDERLLHGMRRAATVLTKAADVKADNRRYAQAVIKGWLAAHSQLTSAALVAPPSDPSRPVKATSPSESLSPADLRAQLEGFKTALRAGGLSGSTIHAYLLGSSLFVRWITGDYVPRGRR